MSKNPWLVDETILSDNFHQPGSSWEYNDIEDLLEASDSESGDSSDICEVVSFYVDEEETSEEAGPAPGDSRHGGSPAAVPKDDHSDGQTEQQQLRHPAAILLLEAADDGDGGMQLLPDASDPLAQDPAAPPAEEGGCLVAETFPMTPTLGQVIQFGEDAGSEQLNGSRLPHPKNLAEEELVKRGVEGAADGGSKTQAGTTRGGKGGPTCAPLKTRSNVESGPAVGRRRRNSSGKYERENVQKEGKYYICPDCAYKNKIWTIMKCHINSEHRVERWRDKIQAKSPKRPRTHAPTHVGQGRKADGTSEQKVKEVGAGAASLTKCAPLPNTANTLSPSQTASVGSGHLQTKLVDENTDDFYVTTKKEVRTRSRKKIVTSCQQFSCRNCTYSTKVRRDIVRHVREKHSRAETLDSKRQIISDSTNIEIVAFTCNYCNFEALHGESIYNHVVETHPNYLTVANKSSPDTSRRPTENILDSSETSQGSTEQESRSSPSSVKKTKAENFKMKALKKPTKSLTQNSKETSYDIILKMIKRGKGKNEKLWPYKYFSCSNCPYKTGSSEKIRRHIKDKHMDAEMASKKSSKEETLLLVCNYCSYETVSLKAIKDHEKEHQVETSMSTQQLNEESLKLFQNLSTTGISLACSYCQFEATDVEQIFDHFQEEHQLSLRNEKSSPRDLLSSCDRAEAEQAVETEHLEAQLSANDESSETEMPTVEAASLAQCEHCRFKTERAWDLILHMADEHSELLHHCPAANCKFRSFWPPALKAHTRAEHPEQCVSYRGVQVDNNNKPAAKELDECDFCSFKSGTRRELGLHMGIAHKEKLKCCHLCPFKTFSSSALDSHQRSQHGGGGGAAAVGQSEPGLTYSCADCHFHTPYLYELEEHAEHEHEHDDEEEEEGQDVCDGRLPCDHCRFSAPNQRSLVLHNMLEHKELLYSCDECDYKSSWLSNLCSHKQQARGAQSCGQARRRVGLKTLGGFLEAQESPAKDSETVFACKDCRFRSANENAMKRHQMLVHNVSKIMAGKSNSVEADSPEGTEDDTDEQNDAEDFAEVDNLNEGKEQQPKSVLKFSYCSDENNETDNNTPRKTAHNQVDLSKDASLQESDSPACPVPDKETSTGCSKPPSTGTEHEPNPTDSVNTCIFCNFSSDDKQRLVAHVSSAHSKSLRSCRACKYETFDLLSMIKHEQVFHQLAVSPQDEEPSQPPENEDSVPPASSASQDTGTQEGSLSDAPTQGNASEDVPPADKPPATVHAARQASQQPHIAGSLTQEKPQNVVKPAASQQQPAGNSSSTTFKQQRVSEAASDTTEDHPARHPEFKRPVPSVYLCDLCPFEANSERDMKMHTIAVHSQKENLVMECDHCKYRSRTTDSMRMHLVQAHKVRYLENKTCTFKMIKVLRKAISSGQGSQAAGDRRQAGAPRLEYTCHLCGHKSYSRTEAQKHKQEDHRMKKELVEETVGGSLPTANTQKSVADKALDYLALPPMSLQPPIKLSDHQYFVSQKRPRPVDNVEIEEPANKMVCGAVTPSKSHV